MLVLEIAAQGLPGAVPACGRATLRPGYNVVAADGVALRRLLDGLLYPSSGGAVANAANATAGITLGGADGATYRLVRRGGSVDLQRFDAQTRAFAPMTSDAERIAAVLAAPVGVPSRERLELLLAARAEELPSRRGSSRRPAAPAVELERTRARLEALRAELERAREAELLQQRLDGLQTRLFKSEEALRDEGRLREADRAARAALDGLAPVAGAERLLGDPGARIAAAARSDARRAEALASTGAEREALPEDAGPPPPWWRLRALWAGLAAGTAAVAVAIAGARASPGLRYLALVDVPAFGWAAWTALRWISSVEEGERVERRRRALGELERKAEEQHARDTAILRQALAAAGAVGRAELEERFAELGEARQAAAAAAARLEAWQVSPEVRDARAERGGLEDEIRDVERRLTARAGAFARDPRTVEADIARVEATLATTRPDPSVGPPARDDDAPLAAPIGGLLSGAAAALGGDPARQLERLAARAALLAGALSGERLGLVVDGASARVVHGGHAVPEALAAPPDQDLCFLAARLAVIERALGAGEPFALVDDAFGGLPEGTRRLVARILRAAAQGAQVLHATTDPAFRDAADHVAA